MNWLDDPLLLLTVTAIVLGTIAGGAVFIGMAFYPPQEATHDPIERIVADLFRSVPTPRPVVTLHVEDSSTGRMRALVASVTEAEAARAHANAHPTGAHRAGGR